MNQLNKLRKKLKKVRKDLRKAYLKTRKYLAVNPLSLSKPPKGWNFQEMKKDYELRNKLAREYRKLLEKYWGMVRRSKRKS